MDELLTRLKLTFVGELDERVQALNHDLLALECETTEAGRTSLLNSLFRSAHSLKGAANSVEIGLVEAACHHLEDVFVAGLEHRLALDPQLGDLLLATVDAIQDAGERLRQDRKIEQGPLPSLLPRLAAIGDGTPRSAPPAAVAATSAAGFALSDRETPSVASRPASPSPQASDLASDDAAGPREPVGRLSPQLVRVAADKLDTLLARSGELMVANRRAGMREEDLGALRQLVRRWRADHLRADRRRTSPAMSSEPAAIPHRAGDRQSGDNRKIVSVAAGTTEFLRRLDRELEHFGATLTADRTILGQAIGAIDSEIRRARMQPLAEVCVGLNRTVRDLARAGGKNVRLVVTGGEVELDRSILDRLKDALLHIVRNAVDHGIESPDRRLAMGKPALGEVKIAAALRGNLVEIVVADDGAGLDLSAIRATAQRRGISDAENPQIAQCIFLPGFSTSAALTNLSGRGVGLDEVRSSVEQMRGSVSVSSVSGEGTIFTLRMPLTLTTLRGLLVRAGGQIFALDSTSIIELRRIAPDSIRSVGGRDMIAVGDGLAPIVPLASLLAIDLADPGGTAGKLPTVLLAAGGSHVALVVDELIDEQELVVRNLGSRLRHVRHVAGATILANGQVALILNTADLVASALDLGLGKSLLQVETAAPRRRRLLLVEDSLTTRTLECSILESAGYEVATAADGVDAWSLLEQHGADLVVSDVDMPRMDGFALTERIRGSQRFHALPVVLVTARENDDEKAQGLTAGADAYLTKSGFDQRVLLETIGQLL